MPTVKFRSLHNDVMAVESLSRPLVGSVVTVYTGQSIKKGIFLSKFFWGVYSAQLWSSVSRAHEDGIYWCVWCTLCRAPAADELQRFWCSFCQVSVPSCQLCSPIPFTRCTPAFSRPSLLDLGLSKAIKWHLSVFKLDLLVCRLWQLGVFWINLAQSAVAIRMWNTICSSLALTKHLGMVLD